MSVRDDRLVKQISTMSIRELTEKIRYHSQALHDGTPQRGYHLNRLEACLDEILTNLTDFVDHPWVVK